MVDFDGVIRDDSNGFQGGELRDEIPNLYAFQAMARIAQAGYSITVFTARALDDDLSRGVYMWMDRWQKYYGVEFKYDVTAQKKPARMYLDDRAVRFTTWADFEKLLR